MGDILCLDGTVICRFLMNVSLLLQRCAIVLRREWDCVLDWQLKRPLERMLETRVPTIHRVWAVRHEILGIRKEEMHLIFVYQNSGNFG